MKTRYLALTAREEYIKFMDHNHHADWNMENEHFSHIVTRIKRQLASLEAKNQKDEAALIDSRKDMWDHAAHSSEDFDQAIEMVQYWQALATQTSAYEAQSDKIRALKKMLPAPYFARIDFTRDGDDQTRKIYIGRSGLVDDKTQERYIYDWRAPIASLFYRLQAGKAFYEAPTGTISGTVSLKRQYEIKDGKLEFFFDSDVEIVDRFLRRLLSRNASSQMRTIVETIQHDQDLAIRDIENDLLLVQGVAGSGKTSIALHRVAFLLYQEVTSKLKANNILILSPNHIFEQYIAHVLPELGEENITSVVFDEICTTVLESIDRPMQIRNEWLEQVLSGSDNSDPGEARSRLQFKGSKAFVSLLHRHIQHFTYHGIGFSDIHYDGKCIASAKRLKTRWIKDQSAKPLAVKLEHLEEFILQKVRKLRQERIRKQEAILNENPDHIFDAREQARLLSINESTLLLAEIRKFTTLNILELYKSLFQNKDYFYGLASGLELPGDIERIIDHTAENLVREQLPYDDALALTYFSICLTGYSPYNDIRQIVIDEAQDYYPLHFEICKLLFKQARYTILGDINQTIEKEESLAWYHQIQDILQKENSVLLAMNKSFRSTDEIIQFSSRLIDTAIPVESFGRSGDVPGIYGAEYFPQGIELLQKEIAVCKEQGYQSIALICKSEKDAYALWGHLRDRIPVQVIDKNHSGVIKDTFIIPVYMAKGLEFDAVLICDVDDTHYKTAADKKLLYIGCTRALHRLNLFYTGTISSLLPRS